MNENCAISFSMDILSSSSYSVQAFICLLHNANHILLPEQTLNKVAE